jgi:hypothetical protein
MDATKSDTVLIEPLDRRVSSPLAFSSPCRLAVEQTINALSRFSQSVS